MPANPVETIQAAIADALQAIQVANGYSQNVGAVYRVDLLEDQVPASSLPALFVLEQSPGETYRALDKNVYRAEMRLLIGGMVSLGQGDLFKPDRVTLLNSLLNDTVKVLLTDVTFGGACKDSVLENRPASVIDTERGFAYFGILMHLTHHFSRSSL
jgi:hypothetical protein